MNGKVVARRSVLAGTGALLVGTAAAVPASASDAQAGRAGRGLTGAWKITRRDAGAPAGVLALATFAAGGAFATVDINPASATNIGGWVADEASGFRAEFWSGTSTPDGTPVMSVIKIKGQWWGDHIQGTYKVSVTVGTHHDHVSGVFHGTRIEP